MVTLGFGALLRGAAATAFRDVPGSIPFPIPAGGVAILGVSIPTDRLVGAAVAACTIALVTWVFYGSRVGVALRAVAMMRRWRWRPASTCRATCRSPGRWPGAPLRSAGALWTSVAGGAFGVTLLGLKVFPIVIIGGLDSIPGAIVGSVLVGVVGASSRAISIPSSGAASAASRRTSCSSPCCSSGRADSSDALTSRACSPSPGAVENGDSCVSSRAPLGGM